MPKIRPERSPQERSPSARDEETAFLLRLGEADGLRRLLTDHAGRVLALLRQDFAGVLNVTELEEALSEAVVLAWRSGERYQAERGSVGAWLFALARNCARRLARESQDGVVQFVGDLDRMPQPSADVGVHEDGPAERLLMAKEALAAVHECLDSLEPRQQAVVAADLTHGGAAPVDDLAAELHVSRNAIYVARNGARRALHEALARRGHQLPFDGDASGGRT